MNVRELIPWDRSRDVTVRRSEETNPLLYREVFPGFNVSSFDFGRGFDRTLAWPKIEVSETDKEVKVAADLPGLEEKDVEVELGEPRARYQGREEDRNGRQGSAVQRTVLRLLRAAFRLMTSRRTR